MADSAQNHDAPFDVDKTTGEITNIPTEPVTVGALALVAGIVDQLKKVEAGFAVMETKYKDVAYDCTTPAGMKAAKAARQDIRQPRYAAQNIVDAAKAPLNTMKAAIASQGAAFIARITAIEDPIDAQIKAQEQVDADRKEAEAKAKAEAEALVDASINSMRNQALLAIEETSAQIEARIETMTANEITLEAFSDRAGEAEQVKGQILAQLQKMSDAAFLREQQAVAMAAQQAEFTRMKEAEEARIAEARAKEEAEAAERRKAEDERLANQRAEQEAEALRLKDQAAKIAEAQKVLDDAKRAEADRIAAIERKRLDDIAAAERAEREVVEAAARAEREATEAIEREAREKAAEEGRLEHQRKGEERERLEADLQRLNHAAPRLLAALVGVSQDPSMRELAYSTRCEMDLAITAATGKLQ